MKLIKMAEFEGNQSWWWDFPENQNGWSVLNEAEFALPEGYTVSSDMMGKYHFYDSEGVYCEHITSYTTDKKGKVAIITDNGGRKWLKMVTYNGELVKPPKNKIEEYRKKLGLTQAQLSQRTGIAQSKIALYESTEVLDNITLGTIKTLAEALECTVNDLIY